MPQVESCGIVAAGKPEGMQHLARQAAVSEMGALPPNPR
jgi:hypothetical protein